MPDKIRLNQLNLSIDFVNAFFHVPPLKYEGDRLGHIGFADAFFWMIEGEMFLMIEDKSYIVSKGQLAFLPKKKMRTYTPSTDNCVIYELTFSASIDGKNIMDYILETANENFKLMVDVYWLSYAGINPVKFLRKYKDMVGGVHYKDLKIVDNAPQMCEVGEGNLDWEEICAVCDEIKPRYIYVEQDRYWTDDDPIKALEISYNNLKKLGYK